MYDDKGPMPKTVMTIQISLGGLVILLVLAILYYCSARERRRGLVHGRPNPSGGPAAGGGGDQDSASSATIIEVGLDEATLRSFPMLVYSGAKLFDDDGGVVVEGGETTAEASCSISLAEFAESDVIRLLPDCGHVFHQKCVDPWLRLRPTCPNCRTSPIPIPVTTTPATTPITTPLSEVTPLAWRP